MALAQAEAGRRAGAEVSKGGYYITDIPLALPQSLPDYCHDDLVLLPDYVSVHLGDVPGFAEPQLAIYNRKANKHVAFDISRLTEEGWRVALRHAGVSIYTSSTTIH